MSAISLEKVSQEYTPYSIEPKKTEIGSPDPSKSQIITKDMDLFWEAYEKMPLSGRGAFFQSEYIEKGTVGVQAFIENRIRNGNHLAEVISEKPEVYSSLVKLRGQTVKDFESQIRASFHKLKELYPPAVFPDIFFVIGANNCGGMSDYETGLIIGAEVMLQDEYYEKIPFIVAHELIHFQQYDEPEDDSEEEISVLQCAIMEGGADFLGELISGGVTNTEALTKYSEVHEEEIWQEFLKDMRSQDPSKVESWFYGGEAFLEDAPNFLGYTVGYKICKAYYMQAEDKDEALRMILQFGNEEEILNKSNLYELSCFRV